MVACSMLDNRQPKPGPACPLGVAFINAVESFKDPWLVFPGDADTVIGHFQHRPFPSLLQRIST